MGNVAIVEQPEFEELRYQRGDVSLCLLVNRRTRSMRIVDFRSGPSFLKREIIRRAAIEERVERLFTVVEREEAPVWTRLGFLKEGSIPGFYKRTDAYVLGMSLAADAPRSKRLALSAKPALAMDDRAERSYQLGRRLVRAGQSSELPEVRLQKARDVEVARSLSAATRTGRELSKLEPFGRGGERTSYLATGRGGFSLLLSVELQRCFDNAFVQMLTAPRSEKEAWLMADALRRVGSVLDEQQVSTVFAISPANCLEMTAALIRGGFRRTGRLPRHLMLGGQRQDAFLWSRRVGEVEHGACRIHCGAG